MNRKQTPSPQKKAQTKSSGRSEELDEIIDRMPMAFGKWVALAVIVFAALFLLFGWIIKYPDMVTGQIKINAQNPTVRLVANSTGNLLLLSHKAQEEVKKGEYIAVVQNPASRGCTEDCRFNRSGRFRRYSSAHPQRYISRQSVFGRNQPPILCLSCSSESSM
ncbi:hypothetical protein NXY25_11515 [Bacteroides thetaiotaomicron]|nr:hypothetical protein [Bacteroides thetaiotaomicron]